MMHLRYEYFGNPEKSVVELLETDTYTCFHHKQTVGVRCLLDLDIGRPLVFPPSSPQLPPSLRRNTVSKSDSSRLTQILSHQFTIREPTDLPVH